MINCTRAYQQVELAYHSSLVFKQSLVLTIKTE